MRKLAGIWVLVVMVMLVMLGVLEGVLVLVMVEGMVVLVGLEGVLVLVMVEEMVVLEVVEGVVVLVIVEGVVLRMRMMKALEKGKKKKVIMMKVVTKMTIAHLNTNNSIR